MRRGTATGHDGNYLSLPELSLEPQPASRSKILAVWAMAAVAFAATLFAAASNFSQVKDAKGRVFFVDADCYARMSRVREVCAHPGVVLRQHDFENYPLGTVPHITVPLDYLTALLNDVFYRTGCRWPRDAAGVWISPLLGVATVAALLFCKVRGVDLGAWMMLAVFVASPIVAHGFAYGRPDHQSLELASIALALAAEWAQWREPSRLWGLVAGGAWAVALWTSLYEPLLLLALATLAGWLFGRERLLRPERLPGLILAGLILLGALWCEGWRLGGVPGLGAGEGDFFRRWSQQIGELRSMPPWSPTLYHWTGWGLLLAPVVLALARGETRHLARAHLLLVAAVFALTCWQVRWGYFLPLIYAMSLPVQFAALPVRWRPVLAALVLAGMWPQAAEWWDRSHPSSEIAASRAEQREDMAALREVAAYIKRDTVENGVDPSLRGVLAPWWLSPPLAYWSQQPAIAGSSHESLPGIVDVARFYLATDPRVAARILHERRARWVLAYEPSRVAATAAPLLGQAAVPRRAMCALLYERPELAPTFLRLVLVNPVFKVYEVLPAALPQPGTNEFLPPL